MTVGSGRARLDTRGLPPLHASVGEQVSPAHHRYSVIPFSRLAALAIAIKPFKVSSSSKRSAWYSEGKEKVSSSVTLPDLLDLGFLTGDSTRPMCFFAQLLSTGTA